MSSNVLTVMGWVALSTTWVLLVRMRQQQCEHSSQKSQATRSKPSSSNTIFKSSAFSDAAILQQLLDIRFQTPLSTHNSIAIERLGPCFMALAQSIQDGENMADALALQTNIPSALHDFLAEDLPGLAQAMCVIAESYLLRAKKGGGTLVASSPLTYDTTSGELLHKSVLGSDAEVPLPDASKSSTSLVRNANATTTGSNIENVVKSETTTVSVECDSGASYHPMKFLAKGSAGEVYAARRVGSKMVQVVDTALAVNQSKRKFLGAIRKQLDQQLVLKKVCAGQ
jgi:hypothetical protein